MAAVSYGHVAIVPKGVWGAETQYEPCNLVEYNGSSYVAKLQPPIGTLPTDTQYWQVSAAGTKKATLDSLGLVKPDNKTTEVDETGVLSVKESTDIIKKSDGTLSLNTTFEEATELANIIAGEAIKEVLGKVFKSIAATMNLDQNALLKNMLSGEDVDDASKIPTSAFIHTLYNRIGMGTDLSAGDATNLTQAVNDLNSSLGNMRLAVITGTTKPSNGNSDKVPLPNGFTIDNAIILNVMIFNSQWYNMPYFDVSDGKVSNGYYLCSDGVFVSNYNASFYSKKFVQSL